VSHPPQYGLCRSFWLSTIAREIDRSAGRAA
jgi:hypothetical protein